MESLDDIIIKRRSWAAMLTLLTPDMAPQHAHIKDHPYYAIKDCVPMPFNWNGTAHINSMMKSFKMVSAKYYDRYGIYTLKAAQAFQLKEVKSLN